MRETVQGIRVVKSFQLERVMAEQMGGGVGAVERINNRMSSIQALVNPLIETLGGLAVASVVLYAGWSTLTQGQTPGEFFAFITALLMAADALLDTPAAEHDDDRPDLRVTRGDVAFDEVTFSYVPGTVVLDRVSFLAPGGKTTALVGLSGSGKTTIFNLLQCFWRPEAGEVRVDGQSIASVRLASLRNDVALVSQDVFLFDGTIRENIAAGREGSGLPDIERAAQAADIDTFIRSLPGGYDTPVGELGGQLSGGQRQRISLARAFLKDAPIILLDEPTSALDSETEVRIAKALRELTRGRTTIVIAHRLSTIMSADVIHVMSAGSVVESGSHVELLRAGGLYAKFHKLQFADPALVVH
jgi:ATP-binding cassette subfamily B protein